MDWNDYIPRQIRALLYDGIVFRMREREGCVRADEVDRVLLDALGGPEEAEINPFCPRLF